MAIVAAPRRPVGMVAQLELKRSALGLRHGAFARLLAVDRSWWYWIRLGKVEPSPELLERAIRLWPGEFERFRAEVIVSRLPAGWRPAARRIAEGLSEADDDEGGRQVG
jgi:hypothetical protein